MNSIENLLVIVSEEAAEISQATSKALRFGLENSYGVLPTNAVQIMTEYYQLQAVIEELQKRMVLPYFTHEDIFDIKKSKMEKINHYNEESRKNGRLKE